MDIEHIPAGKFKAHCLKLLDEVKETKRPLIITKHGKAVAKLVPLASDQKAEKPLFGCMKGTIKIHGDIVSPMTDVWNLPE